MNAAEWRNAVVLSMVFALRMAGLFLILPIFSLEAPKLVGGENSTLVGLALGAFGLTQMMLHLALGACSDRLGRKPVILAGLFLFALGSLVAANTSDIRIIILGRIIQGAGAISSVLMALAADLTRPSQRTKVMALIGGSIGVSFALCLVLAPWLYRFVGLSGIFNVTGVLALLGMVAVGWGISIAPRPQPQPRHIGLVMRIPGLWRFHAGIGLLHMAQMAVFIVVPPLLVKLGHLPAYDHWKVYLPVVLISFFVAVPLMMAAEHRGYARHLMLVMSLLWMIAAALLSVGTLQYHFLLFGLFVFFCAFNVLEAMLPSALSSKVVQAHRGAAMGLFSTAQSGGIFIGGLLFGTLTTHGLVAVFVAMGILGLLWGIICLRLDNSAPHLADENN